MLLWPSTQLPQSLSFLIYKMEIMRSVQPQHTVVIPLLTKHFPLAGLTAGYFYPLCLILWHLITGNITLLILQIRKKILLKIKYLPLNYRARTKPGLPDDMSTSLDFIHASGVLGGEGWRVGIVEAKHPSPGSESLSLFFR